MLDLDAIARACKRYGVERLRIFGSALTDHFDPEGSDIDFLVDFAPGKHQPASCLLRSEVRARAHHRTTR